MEVNTFYDIVIVGAGPAGTSCAIGLKDAGLKVLLIDKDTFPREKTCGDGLTLDVVKQLPLISDALPALFELLPKTLSYGVKVTSIDGKAVRIPVLPVKDLKCMYTVKRIDFDNMLMQFVKQKTHTTLLENTPVNKVERVGDAFCVHTDKENIKCRFIIGADGASSVVAKCLRPFKIDDKNKIIALRQYYSGVKFDDAKQFLEFYYIRKMLPGGIWVFPEAGNMANVGLGLLLSDMKKKKINLKNVLKNEIENGILKKYFQNAKPIGKLEGHIIPVGKNNRSISGEAYLLAGDAAALANAFTGEGIGNALRSGRVAAEHTIKCFKEANFSAHFNKNFDKEIYRRMGKEFNNYRLLQYLCSYPLMTKFLINRMAPLFVDVYGNPDYIQKAHSKRFFILRLLKSFFRIK